MKILILISKRTFGLAVLIFAGCADSVTGPENEIYGKWDWINTTGGFAGVYRTPESEGYKAHVFFGYDHNAKFYINDSLMARVRFFIGKSNSNSGRKDEDIIIYEGTRPPQVVSFIGKDTLRLSEDAADGFNYAYTRSKQFLGTNLQ